MLIDQVGMRSQHHEAALFRQRLEPITKKPLETRMGKGKGNPEGWVAVIRPGNLILELSGCSEIVAREALSRASSKVPMRCRMLMRHKTA